MMVKRSINKSVADLYSCRISICLMGLMLSSLPCTAGQTTDSNVIPPFDSANCSQKTYLTSLHEQHKVIFQSDVCEKCDGLVCVSYGRKTCNIYFDVADDFLQKVYKTCIDVLDLHIENCMARVDISGKGIKPKTLFCKKKKNKFFGTRFCAPRLLHIKSINTCEVKGHAFVFLSLQSQYALAYDLTDLHMCGEGHRDLDHSPSYQIISHFNSKSNILPAFCIIKIDQLIPIRRFCITFEHAYFPNLGAMLVVENNAKKFVFNREDHPSVGVEKCYITDGVNSLSTLYIEPYEYFNWLSMHYNHEFIFTITFHTSLDTWTDNSDDTYVPLYDNEKDTHFLDNFLVVVAVFCLAKFVFCYWSCTKFRKNQNRYQQQRPFSDPILEGNVIDQGNRNVAVDVYPGDQMIIDSSPDREQNSFYSERLAPFAGGLDEPPPSYADVSLEIETPPPSPPPVPHSPSGGCDIGQAGMSPALPPAYESLFPNRA